MSREHHANGIFGQIYYGRREKEPDYVSCGSVTNIQLPIVHRPKHQVSALYNFDEMWFIRRLHSELCLVQMLGHFVLITFVITHVG